MIRDLPQSLIEAATKHLTHIDVDGELKHRFNSEGNPIHHTEEGIKNFHRWFGDNSNFVDVHGRPRVAYHGTTKQFTEFKRSTYGAIGPGIYFGDSKDVAEAYAGDSKQAKIVPVYIRGHVIDHVTKYSPDYVLKHGWAGAETNARHDGVTGVHDKKFECAINVFDPSDVKSASDNDGTFNHPTKITESTNYQIREQQ